MNHTRNMNFHLYECSRSEGSVSHVQSVYTHPPTSIELMGLSGWLMSSCSSDELLLLNHGLLIPNLNTTYFFYIFLFLLAIDVGYVSVYDLRNIVIALVSAHTKTALPLKCYTVKILQTSGIMFHCQKNDIFYTPAE